MMILLKSKCCCPVFFEYVYLKKAILYGILNVHTYLSVFLHFI